MTEGEVHIYACGNCGTMWCQGTYMLLRKMDAVSCPVCDLRGQIADALRDCSGVSLRRPEIPAPVPPRVRKIRTVMIGAD